MTVVANLKQRADGGERQQLEQLCRYVMRPPLSQERLGRHREPIQLPERIEHLDAGRLEIGLIPGDDHQVMDEGRRGDQAVLDRHGAATLSQVRQEGRPSQTCFWLPVQALDAPDPFIEPTLQGGSLLAPRQQEYAESNLTQDDGVDRDGALVLSQPFDDQRLRLGPRGLAEYVGVDEVLHMLSVDSPSTGTK